MLQGLAMASSARADGSTAVAKGADNLLLLTPKRPNTWWVAGDTRQQQDHPWKVLASKDFPPCQCYEPFFFCRQDASSYPDQSDCEECHESQSFVDEGQPDDKEFQPKRCEEPRACHEESQESGTSFPRVPRVQP